MRDFLKLEEISMTFFGPVPLVVSIFKKVTTADSWQLWRVFRDDCSNDSMCSQLGVIKLDGERLMYNLVDANLGPVQRRASSLRVRLSGHRHEDSAQLRNISYFGLYNVAISRRVPSLCGIFGYVTQESNSTCQPCNCDVRGVIDGSVECNEIGGQCACKRYVTGRRCDRCLSGYDNIRESDPDGCSSGLTKTTTSSGSTTSSLICLTAANIIGIVAGVVIVIIVVIIVIVAVIYVRRRRLRQRDSVDCTDKPATDLKPTFKGPMADDQNTANVDPDYFEIN
ncbi:hypothetical protein LSAT2_031208 [Lamellibrachia satsuma]|nr:hypothetical protein LSAT2_031208 [Lamellibrachia satsuma]